MAGRRIDDHSSWMGSSSKESPLPMGNKVKYEESTEGAGGIGKYEDTTEAIKAQQQAGVKKIRGHAQPSEKRN